MLSYFNLISVHSFTVFRRNPGVGCTLKVEVCIDILNTQVCCFLTVKSHVYRVERQKVAALLLCFPKRRWLGLENVTADTMEVERVYGVACVIAEMAILYLVTVRSGIPICTADPCIIQRFSKVASHNCGGRKKKKEKSERNQHLHTCRASLLP